MRCATAAINKAGLVLDTRARDAMSESLKTVLKEKSNRYCAAVHAHDLINRAGTDDEEWGWLARVAA